MEVTGQGIHNLLWLTGESPVSSATTWKVRHDDVVTQSDTTSNRMSLSQTVISDVTVSICKGQSDYIWGRSQTRRERQHVSMKSWRQSKTIYVATTKNVACYLVTDFRTCTSNMDRIMMGAIGLWKSINLQHMYIQHKIK
jgi:hypothetical protein